MEGLTEGRIVHYVLAEGIHRPAIVVNVWEGENDTRGYVNLLVFTDKSNDLWHVERNAERDAEIRTGILWATSVYYDEEKKVHTWHWIEKA